MARALCPGASYHEQTVLQSHTCTTSVPTQNNDMYGKEHGQGTSLSGASAAGAYCYTLCDALAQRRSLYVPYGSNYMSLFCVGTELIQVGDGSTVCSWLLAPGNKARAIVTVCCVLVFNKKP